MAKKFFFVCAGIFLLALTYHLGARSAGAQGPGNPVVAATVANGSAPVAITANGDSYAASYSSTIGTWQWYHTGNAFSNLPTGTTQQSWGQVKDRYRR